MYIRPSDKTITNVTNADIFVSHGIINACLPHKYLFYFMRMYHN